jgi:hypothetical protein
MTGQLQQDGVAIEAMDGVSMAVDWVRVYRKVRDVRPAQLPELEPFALPQVVARPPQVAPAGRHTQVLAEDFEARTALPDGWEVGDGAPAVVATSATAGGAGRALQLNPGDYVFRLLGTPLTGRLEVEFDCLIPSRGEALLFVTLGEFDRADAALRRESYYRGDIGPYIHWNQGFIQFYTETEKWTPFTTWRHGKWARVRFLLDVDKAVFDCYAGKDLAEFQGGGLFRHHPQAVRGIGLRHRGRNGAILVDNLVVRTLGE